MDQACLWRGGRVVECGGLEIRYGGNVIVGSNPTLSVGFENGMALFI